MRTFKKILALAALCATAVHGAVSAADNDVATLNYALTLERLEAAYYAAGQAKWSASDFVAANYTQGNWDYFNLIRDHEKAHVSFLQTALGARAAVACGMPLFADKLDTVNNYVKFAMALEETGVGAYDGAINFLSDPNTQQNAATIATIEARHAAYLRQVNGMPAQSSAPLDRPSNVTQVLAAAMMFINLTGCPALTVPVIRPAGVATTSTLALFTRTSPDPLPANTFTYTQAMFDNDMKVLNYALTLENLEAAYYAAGQNKFQLSAFTDAYGPVDGVAIRNNFELIAQHEAAHVSALNATILARGGIPVKACMYNVSAALVDVRSYVSTARVLESVGVGAYDWAIAGIADTGLATVAATIATIEARHASYLNTVNGFNATAGLNVSADPNLNFDKFLTPQQVLAAAGPFFISCPTGSEPSNQVPTFAPSGLTGGGGGGGSSGGSSSSSGGGASGSGGAGAGSSSTGTGSGDLGSSASCLGGAFSTLFALIAAVFAANKCSA